ncbi:hypothetical protein [Nonomuraea helvata]|uniref:Transposase n=1 Tax=Nonomuraea helvata TaxID=37484 RepID=A0ABV5SH36_9ACTN
MTSAHRGRASGDPQHVIELLVDDVDIGKSAPTSQSSDGAAVARDES